MNIIAESPSPEMYRSGLELDCCCARCGSSVDADRCGNCEDGWILADDDDEWGEDEPCPWCGGKFITHRCLSSPEWCGANPLPGREDVPRGKVEWYTIGAE